MDEYEAATPSLSSLLLLLIIQMLLRRTPIIALPFSSSSTRIARHQQQQYRQRHSISPLLSHTCALHSHIINIFSHQLALSSNLRRISSSSSSSSAMSAPSSSASMSDSPPAPLVKRQASRKKRQKHDEDAVTVASHAKNDSIAPPSTPIAASSSSSSAPPLERRRSSRSRAAVKSYAEKEEGDMETESPQPIAASSTGMPKARHADLPSAAAAASSEIECATQELELEVIEERKMEDDTTIVKETKLTLVRKTSIRRKKSVDVTYDERRFTPQALASQFWSDDTERQNMRREYHHHCRSSHL